MKRKDAKPRRSIAKQHPLKPFLIGTYQLGWRIVDVTANPSSRCGQIELVVNRKKPTQITVGMDYRDVRDAWNVLLHEALESLLADENACYKRTDLYLPDASDTFHFIFTHNQFSETVARLAWFTWLARADFEKAFKRCRSSFRP